MINIHDYCDYNNIKNIHVNILNSWRAWLINDGNRERARVEGWERETT